MSLTPEQIASLRALVREMVSEKTNLAIDAIGDVWAFGRWYGEHAHFRKNFGHWSETVLEEQHDLFTRLWPLRPYHAARPLFSDEDRKWTDFYLKKPD